MKCKPIFENFAANAALVANQWQHCTWIVPLHPTIYAIHEAGQTASTMF